MAKANLRITRDLKAPEVEGIHYRVLCMTGENKGISYYLRDKRFVLGRSKEVDIQVLDTNCSREHVELAFFKGEYILTDLGSHNGVIVNDLNIKQHTMKDGDRIIIGKTVYKYNIYNNKASENKELVEEEIDADNNDSKESEDNLESTNDTPKDNKKKIIYGVVILALVYMFLDESDTKIVKKKAIYSENKDIDDQFTRMLKKKVKIENAKNIDKLNIIIARGLREMREKNYFRAIEEFEIARILSPSNGSVSYYISKAKQYLDEDVNQYFLKSRREIDALKYSDAQNSYCTIIQLLRDYPDDERYKKAEKEIKELEKKLGVLEGIIICLRGV